MPLGCAFMTSLSSHSLLRGLVVLVPTVILMILTRPLADDWPEAVDRMRRKERDAAGSFAAAMQPVRVGWRSEAPWSRLSALTWRRCSAGTRHWDEEGYWAVDGVVVTLACTRKACFAGVLGRWQRLPGRKVDVYALVGTHGASCAISYAYGLGFFYRHFAPRFSRPHTILFSAFATSHPFTLLWLASLLLGIGSELQRALGRIGFALLCTRPLPFDLLFKAHMIASLALSLECAPIESRSHGGADLGGALITSLFAAAYRRSNDGTGGVLALCCYHALAAPNAQHNIFGIQMGAKMALACQVAIASLPAFSGGQSQPGTTLVMAALPLAVGAVAFRVTTGRFW